MVLLIRQVPSKTISSPGWLWAIRRLIESASRRLLRQGTVRSASDSFCGPSSGTGGTGPGGGWAGEKVRAAATAAAASATRLGTFGTPVGRRARGRDRHRGGAGLGVAGERPVRERGAGLDRVRPTGEDAGPRRRPARPVRPAARGIAEHGLPASSPT